MHLHRLAYERFACPLLLSKGKARLARLLQEGGVPRIALVKQDVQEDLYCCPRGSSAREIVLSTLLRSGPVALFSKFGAEFYIVNTEDDNECTVWKEKATVCHWGPLAWFEAFRDKVPGRSCGQKDFALSAEVVDWGRFDLVIGIDVPIPARITSRYPGVIWACFIREVKTPAFEKALAAPPSGWDLTLNHGFRPSYLLPELAGHVVEFPYHLQYYGCFYDLLERTVDEGEVREGIFLEAHTGQHISQEELSALNTVGKVYGTHLGGRNKDVPSRTMEPENLQALLTSKYFLKFSGRPVMGTAMIEAVAAGCLAIGDPSAHGHSFFYSPLTSGATLQEIMGRIRFLDEHPEAFVRELKRQRMLLDYHCFVRPSLALFAKVKRLSAEKKARRGA